MVLIVKKSNKNLGYNANLQVIIVIIVLINKDNILISSDFIKNPKYVSYAWSDTPEATLFNSDGFLLIIYLR